MADDDDLSARLAALKTPTSVPTTPQKNGNTTSNNTVKTPYSDNDDDLSARFEQIFAHSPGSRARAGLPPQESIPKNEEDAKSTAELAAAVQEEKDIWNVSAADERAIEALLAEAAMTGFDPATLVEEKLLAGGETETKDDAGSSGGNGNGNGNGNGVADVPDWLRDDTLDDVKSDADEEEATLRRIRDELAFELTHDLSDPTIKPIDTNDKPQINPEDAKDIDALMSRFAALGELSGSGFGDDGGSGDGDGELDLPSVPSKDPGLPAHPKFQVAPKDPDGELVHETDTWCCICNEDAEYRCSGCEGDIYCSECLFEAHTGPNAGLEEKRHKWTKYIRPKRILQGA